MNKNYKIFIVGGGSRLEKCLPIFTKSKYELLGVLITKNENILSIKKLLKKENINIFNRWNTFVKLANRNTNVIVFFISHNKLIDPKEFKTAHLINYHASPLPKYRGGSPMNWAIINDEKEFGVSIHELVKSIDAGPVLLQEHFCIENFDYLKLVQRVNEAFLRLTKILLKSFDAHWNHRIIQDKKLATYFHQRSSENSCINFLEMDAKKIYKMYLALPDPLPRPYFKFRGKDLIITSCKLTEINYSGEPGRVIGNFEGGVVVICKYGSIVINNLKQKNMKFEFPAKKYLKFGDQIYD